MTPPGYGLLVVRYKVTPAGLEEIPEPCPDGHRTTPAWTSCPQCGWGVRVWRCTVCPDRDVIDPDHVCRESAGRVR